MKYVVKFFDEVEMEWQNMCEPMEYDKAMEVLVRLNKCPKSGGLAGDHYDIFKV